MIVENIDNPRFPCVVTITRNVRSDNAMSDTTETLTLYSGEGRMCGMSRGGDEMVTNRRITSIPVVWDIQSAVVLPKDDIVVSCGETTERGVVDDIMAGNLGTNVYWTAIRN